MLTRRLLLAGLGALVLASCGRDEDAHPPHWASVCAASHTEMHMAMIPGGIGGVMGGIHIGGGVHLVPQYQSVCDRREWACDAGGPDFRGDRACPAKPSTAP